MGIRTFGLINEWKRFATMLIEWLLFFFGTLVGFFSMLPASTFSPLVKCIKKDQRTMLVFFSFCSLTCPDSYRGNRGSSDYYALLSE